MFRTENVTALNDPNSERPTNRVPQLPPSRPHRITSATTEQSEPLICARRIVAPVPGTANRDSEYGKHPSSSRASRT